MDLESHQSLQQQFVAPEMRSDSTPTNCDLGTFLSFSCRTRAEDFARTLQIKLKTLGSFDGDESSTSSSPPDPGCWKSMSLDSHLSRQKEALKRPPSLSNISHQHSQSQPYKMTPNTPTEPTQNGNKSVDSDIFYDFDIASPGSPVENGSCYRVINPCDDLYCTDCIQSSSNGEIKGSIHHNPNQKNEQESNGMESGCIFSSPASSSPDGNTTLAPVFNIQIQHSNSADDCTSETSDCSIYYDVESFSSPIPSPKPGLCEIAGPSEIQVNVPDISKLEISETKKNNKIQEISDEKMKQLLSPHFDNLNGDDDGGSSEEENSITTKIPRITRSSSLKTGKTPPSTPGRKKIVRFADALGLDLAAVRTFLDEIPKVPKSAFSDLDYPIEPFNPSVSQKPALETKKILVPTFHQPITRPDFLDRIKDCKVLLENAYLSDNFTIKGAVRVLNMDFYKSVYIRYTYDEWKTFVDFQASYVTGSCDGFSDRFEFTLYLRPEMMEIGSRLIVAVRFHCKGEQFWDNNCGSNYLFHCVPGTQQSQQNPYQESSSLYSSSIYGSSQEDPWTNHMWL